MSIGGNLKVFVREQGALLVLPKNKRPAQLSTGLAGEEAKSFYEEIISSSLTLDRNPQKKTKRKVVRAKETVQIPKPLKSIFHYAQDNDIIGLRNSLHSGVNVNLTDKYGWTSLMCAACNGSTEAIQFLLEAGADLSIRDKGGYNALTLARKHNHQNIVKLLTNGRYQYEDRSKNDTSVEEGEQICELCNEKYNGRKVKHESSTVHLLKKNESHVSRTFYGIPESNKGFQLLMQQGWDRDRGLGPAGSGRKFPIKARVKPDRSGIGSKSKTDRRDDAPVTLKSSSRRDERRLERNFRREFL